MQQASLMNIGKYQGLIADAFYSDALMNQLANIQNLLAGDQVETLSQGADKVFKLPLNLGAGEILITVKVFKRQALFKDWYDRKHKSKAERSYRAALHLQAHGIGTPAPIAWLEQWQGKRLLESYYLCIYEPAICWRDALSDLYYHQRDNEPLLALLQTVVPAVRAMHDAGFMHGDMGNQNILLPKTDSDKWAKPQFIDLNRAQIQAQPLSAKQRAFDLSRIALPGAYLKLFKFIYCHPEDIPQDLDKYEQEFRRRFEWHTKTRKYRRPLRALKRYLAQKNKPTRPAYPTSNNIWLWDEKSAQPMTVLDRREKNSFRNLRYALALTWHSLSALPRIIRNYRNLLRSSYEQPVAMRNRIGVALHPKQNYIPHELELLESLENPPVFIRFYHHETPHDWALAIDLIQQLHKKNIPIMVAMVQDRRAVLERESWQVFLHTVIPAIADQVEYIQVTQALNRVKWGIWTAAEYSQLMQPVFALQQQFPQLKFTGPACIDFEYHPCIAALAALKKGQKLSALSHLLYVDRRGAPENKQGAFSTLEKTALLKALAQSSPHTDDKVIISEVNWPIKHTGIWSPIGCPYETPKWLREQPGENDEDYANYMLRFMAITLCSGHAEQVFWWRLSAHGYGLVDDLNDFTPRPAFFALKMFLQQLKDATFVRRWPSDEKVYILEFSKNDSQLLMAWNTDNRTQHTQPFLDYTGWSRDGTELNDLTISESPIYLLRER